jgi:hypothetical protein
MASRRVVYAKLQTSLHIPRICDFGSTLPPNKTFEKFEMTYAPEGILIEACFQGKRGSIVVPWTNVIGAEFVDGDAPVAKAEEKPPVQAVPSAPVSTPSTKKAKADSALEIKRKAEARAAAVHAKELEESRVKYEAEQKAKAEAESKPATGTKTPD